MRKSIQIICTILGLSFAMPLLHAQEGSIALQDAPTIESPDELSSELESALGPELQGQLAEVRQQRAILREKWAEKLTEVRGNGPEAVRQGREEFLSENKADIESLRQKQAQVLSEVRALNAPLQRSLHARAEDGPLLAEGVRDYADAVRALREAINAELAARIDELETVTPDSLKQVRKEVLAKYADQLAALRAQGDAVRMNAGKGPPPGKHPHGMPPGLAKRQDEMRQLRDVAREESQRLGQIISNIMRDNALTKEEKRERAQDAKRIWREQQQQRREQVKELRRQLRELDERG